MKKITCLYKGTKEFLTALSDEEFDVESQCLVRIHTSNFDRTGSVFLAKQLKRYLPRAIIIGSSSSGVIYKGKILENTTLIVVQSFRNLAIKRMKYSWKDKSPQLLAQEVYFDYFNDPKNLLHIIFSDNYPDVTEFTDSINEYSPVLKLAGGIATPNSDEYESGFIFDDEGVIEQGALAFQLIGDILNDKLSFNIPNDPISDIYTINKMDGSVIEEVEHMPAKEWAKNYFRIHDSGILEKKLNNEKLYESYLVHFLMILENRDGAGRFIKYDKEKDQVALYYSKLPENVKFRIGFFNPMKSRQKLSEMFYEMMNRDIESLFCYVCIFRKKFFTNMIETELSPLLETDISGIFMNGEICYLNGKNQMLNGSFLLSEFAEEENKCVINMQAFDETSKIKLDPTVVDFVMNEKRNELHKQAKFFGNRDYENVDAYTQFSNIIQFNIDNQAQEFNRMLLIYVENADMIIGSEGYSKYISTVVDSVNQIKKHISDNFSDTVYIYELSYCIYVLTVKRDVVAVECKNAMYSLIENYRVIQPENTNIPVVLKFVMVIGKDNMLQKAITGLQETKQLNIPYMIYDDSENMPEFKGKMESNVIAVLNNAVNNDNVVPYYQGIYNNETKKIEKYEALMRIIDGDKVYAPGYFMDIAKKYHIYLQLSKMMIDRVLKDFEYRDEVVSINIAASDIYSKDFCNWFWKRIECFSRPQNLIIEIVESEELKDWTKAGEFIEKVREKGMAIAIDDFGDGYSNLMQMIRLRPKYIKVDGSIVKDVCTNVDNQVAIQTINFLSQNIGAQVVAEYVENEEIQTVVEKENIKFSQGYYFSKPKPLEEI